MTERPFDDESARDLWSGVDRLLERGPTIEGLMANGVELLAVRRWRRLGARIPESLLTRERAATLMNLLVSPVLERVRAAYDGPMVLMKGPVLATLYPGETRAYSDLDILVDDPERAHRSLIAAGFHEVDDPDLFMNIHHLRPLMLEGMPLKVELHSSPKWPEGFAPPSVEEIFARSVGGGPALVGFSVPDPPAHAVMVAAHAWAHAPLRALRDLIDIAALIAGTDGTAARQQAQAWNIERPWQTTADAIDALILQRRPPTLAQRLWAPHLGRVRERTVFESHLLHWLSPYWALPPRPAFVKMAASIARDVRPVEGEGWRGKLNRSFAATRRAFVPRSRHDAILGHDAKRGSRPRGPADPPA